MYLEACVQKSRHFSPFFFLGGWNAGHGGNRNPEKDSQLPGHQVAETLLEYVQVRQEYNSHHFGARHTPVHTGIQGAVASDQCTAATVGRRRWAKHIEVSTPGGHQTLSNHPPSPTPPLSLPYIIPNPSPHQYRRLKTSQGSKCQEGGIKARKGGQGTPVPP